MPLLQGIVGNLSSGKSALVHRYLTGTYVQEESPEGERGACVAPSYTHPSLSSVTAWVRGGLKFPFPHPLTSSVENCSSALLGPPGLSAWALLTLPSVLGGRFKKEIVVDGQSYLLLIRDEGGPPELQVMLLSRVPGSPPVPGTLSSRLRLGIGQGCSSGGRRVAGLSLLSLFLALPRGQARLFTLLGLP